MNNIIEPMMLILSVKSSEAFFLNMRDIKQMKKVVNATIKVKSKYDS